jgi:hypothetical protein
MVDAGLRYWSEANRVVLAALPMERSLILRTEELSTSIPRLAALVGVPPETLRTDLSHLHRARRKYHLLLTLDPSFLADRYRRYCADLMDEYFPAATLDRFLERSTRAQNGDRRGARSAAVGMRASA